MGCVLLLLHYFKDRGSFRGNLVPGYPGIHSVD